MPSKIFCRILIEGIKTDVVERLREEQAGFRQETDQILTLRNTLELRNGKRAAVSSKAKYIPLQPTANCIAAIKCLRYYVKLI